MTMNSAVYVGRDVLNAQHASLDATNAHASAWEVALNGPARVSWGGRGRGGRGTARRTFQPRDIVVDGVDMEYMNDAAVTGCGGGGSKVLLRNAYLKLLPGRTYTLIGRNGVGKSTLLKRIKDRKIPGFPPHISSLLVPQEVFGHDDLTPLDLLLDGHSHMAEEATLSRAVVVERLEEEMDALDAGAGDYQEQVERLCQCIAEVEGDEAEGGDGAMQRARDALCFFGVPEAAFSTPTAQLSGGVRKKVALAMATMEKPQLLLLDEPTCHIDIRGILQLRRLIAECVDANTTVVLISHDVDLMNDAATDVIHFHSEMLEYYPGNYRDFRKYREERITHQVKQAGALEKQRTAMVQTIDNLKKKSSHAEGRTTKKKLNRTIKSKEKKLERHGVEKNDHGHRRKAQVDGGLRKGSINAMDAGRRNALSHKELLKLADIDIGPVPDKAIQFQFQNTSATWGDEPLVMVMDVGHSYDEKITGGASDLIFDCVDLSIREGSRTTILGENGSGKSSLLSIIAGEVTPSIGTVHVATGLSIGHFHQHSVDNLMYGIGSSGSGDIITPLLFLSQKFPSKSEQDIRDILFRFGLSPKQAGTDARFLSGGERCRVCMASMMLESPQLLVIDEITNHLDVESVEALIFGLREWNGTVVLASHDGNLIRQMGGEVWALVGGNLRMVDGGIDTYLNVFAK